MNPTPGKLHQVGSKTGMMPRIDLEPEIQHEPPTPPLTLPEIEGDSGSITGIIRPMKRPEEGEDKAKQSDDTPSPSSAPG